MTKEFTNRSFAYCDDEHMYEMFRRVQEKPIDAMVKAVKILQATGRETPIDEYDKWNENKSIYY